MGVAVGGVDMSVSVGNSLVLIIHTFLNDFFDFHWFLLMEISFLNRSKININHRKLVKTVRNHKKFKVFKKYWKLTKKLKVNKNRRKSIETKTSFSTWLSIVCRWFSMISIDLIIFNGSWSLLIIPNFLQMFSVMVYVFNVK